MTYASARALDFGVTSLIDTAHILDQLLPTPGAYNVPARDALALFGHLRADLNLGADLPDWPADMHVANRWADMHWQRRNNSPDGHTATLELTAQEMAPVADFLIDGQQAFCRIQQRDNLWLVELAGYDTYRDAGRPALLTLVEFRNCKPARA